jgi:hypothetical protein
MTTADVIRGAIALLETRGRCIGRAYDAQGRVCAIQALEECSDNFIDAEAILAVRVAANIQSGMFLSQWNDATADDAVVLDAFRRALANEEAKEAKP